MKKGISKNRPKGAEYGRIKSHEKLARKLEDKKRVGQIENAKKNAVRRKEKEAKKEFYDMIDEIKVIDFIKNKGIPVRLLTNGYLLGRDEYIEIANKCDEVLGEIKIIDENDFI